MARLLEYKIFKGTIEYSKEDGCFFGKVLGLQKDCITYEGQDLKELQKDFEEAIEDYMILKAINNEQH